VEPDFEEVALETAPTLESTVTVLSEKIGERNLNNYPRLEQTRDYITRRLKNAGYQVELDEFKVDKPVYNLVFTKPGNKEIVVVGAHYDSAPITPGANDNGSGVAVLLQLAERLKEVPMERTVRFVFFVNEEPPYFMGDSMGSRVYAARCAERKDNIVGMISLETMGYYSDVEGSQMFPPGIEGYPNTGNFLAFISEPNSQKFLQECLDHFEGLPVESLVAPASVEGVSWSDHASFWEHGYPGVMITDTAPFRYPHYHRKTDTADQLDYQRLGRAADGLETMIKFLGRAKDLPGDQTQPVD
jgi:Zn-dependent M28 family amino/carboxypeptidase